jgi:arylsulfatase A-like enzyme
VRTALQLTDRDGDGFSFAFGGGDCDDRRADVYPGARDEPGDGIDADCFGGDGSAAVMDFGDGAYGPVPPLPTRANFLLVTVDALRPDHLGSGGYARDTSPNLDAFAATAVRFERALAQSTRSIRSIPAMFTGLYPSQIGYGPEYLYPSLLPENRTVAEELQAAGYQTAVVMGTNYFDRTGGFFQGFTDVYQSPTYKPPRSLPIDQTLPRLRAMAASARPFFLWVHFFNVHEEYLWDRTPSRYGDAPKDKYDTEIRFMDEQVKRLLDEVRALGLNDRTVVIFASDHGEAFGEHGTQGHSWTLYEEELRATLMIRVPGIAPRVVSEEVGLFDLMPTMLNLAGIPMPRPVPARSLVPLLTGHAPPRPTGGPRLLFGELMPDGLYPFDVKTVRRDGMKLHFWLRENRVELYDLRADPHERRDLSDSDTKTRDELLALIRSWLGSTAHPSTRRDAVLARARLSAPPPNMTRRLDARYADAITLIGFDLPRTTFAPNERIPLTLYLRADREIERNLFFEVTFEGPPGYPVPPHFHAAHYPLHGNYFTNEWRAGEVLRDAAEIVVPHDIQRPVKLRMRLAVRDGASVLPYRMATGTGFTLDLAEVEVR